MSCGIPALYDSRQIGITASLHTIYMKRCSNPYCVPLKFLKRYLCGINVTITQSFLFLYPPIITFIIATTQIHSSLYETSHSVNLPNSNVCPQSANVNLPSVQVEMMNHASSARSYRAGEIYSLVYMMSTPSEERSLLEQVLFTMRIS